MSIINNSRKLSHYLRHSSDANIYPGGWVRLVDVFKALNLLLKDIFDIVKTDDKERYSFDPVGSCIRANYGHSLLVNMLYVAIPKDTWAYPTYLCHLTKREFVQSIFEKGLLPGKRNYVHTSYYSGYEELPKADTDEVWLEINTELIDKELYNPCGRTYLTEHIPAKAIRIYE